MQLRWFLNPEPDKCCPRSAPREASGLGADRDMVLSCPNLFSPNVDHEQRDFLSNILGFRSTSNLGSYLGFPLRHAGSSNQDLNFVLSRVEQKLAGWKSNLLSFAGCQVLIQASISSISSYIMQSVLLPSRILDKLDKISWNFLWGSSDSRRKMHWVGWDKVTKPKAEGGLGI